MVNVLTQCVCSKPYINVTGIAENNVQKLYIFFSDLLNFWTLINIFLASI